jgi:hypothetical protein
MKTYVVERVGGRVTATVVESDGQYALRHLVHHSLDGFEYGYGGSGPSDLARSIIGDFLNHRDPSPAIYQDFKFAFVAKWDGNVDRHEVTEDEINAWFNLTGYYRRLKA